jgi:acetyltransferase
MGSMIDPDFGPFIRFGAGGQMGEIFRDVAIALPPLNATLARRLMRQTKVYSALAKNPGEHGIDMRKIEQALIGFSNFVAEQRGIQECDVNPMAASPDGVIAVGSRIVLHDQESERATLPRVAIRPYPTEYRKHVQLRDGTQVILRPIRLEDEPLMVKFHETLSDESVRRRYFQLLKLHSRINHNRLVRLCYTDYDREVALVAEYGHEDGEKSILGVARLSRRRGSCKAEFAIIVSDAWQGQGLGRILLEMLIEVGLCEGIHRIVGYMLKDNWRMEELCRKLGFQLMYDAGEVRATLTLGC